MIICLFTLGKSIGSYLRPSVHRRAHARAISLPFPLSVLPPENIAGGFQKRANKKGSERRPFQESLPTCSFWLVSGYASPEGLQNCGRILFKKVRTSFSNCDQMQLSSLPRESLTCAQNSQALSSPQILNETKAF